MLNFGVKWVRGMEIKGHGKDEEGGRRRNKSTMLFRFVSFSFTISPGPQMECDFEGVTHAFLVQYQTAQFDSYT